MRYKRKWPRILVVDDHADTILVLTDFFKLMFYESFEFKGRTIKGEFGFDGEVVGALDGEMALRILSEEGPFDLVLTDAEMPRINGAELLRQIRAGMTDAGPCGTPRDVLVALVTAFPMRLKELEFDLFIAKPFHFDEIGEKISHLLGVSAQ